MEGISLAVGIALMMVAAFGILGYVALVIAIPVCRLIDWLAGEEPQEEGARPVQAARTMATPQRTGPTPLARLALVVASPLITLSAKLRRGPVHDEEKTVCPACRRPLEALE